MVNIQKLLAGLPQLPADSLAHIAKFRKYGELKAREKVRELSLPKPSRSGSQEGLVLPGESCRAVLGTILAYWVRTYNLLACAYASNSPLDQDLNELYGKLALLTLQDAFDVWSECTGGIWMQVAPPSPYHERDSPVNQDGLTLDPTFYCSELQTSLVSRIEPIRRGLLDSALRLEVDPAPEGTPSNDVAADQCSPAETVGEAAGDYEEEVSTTTPGREALPTSPDNQNGGTGDGLLPERGVVSGELPAPDASVADCATEHGRRHQIDAFLNGCSQAMAPVKPLRTHIWKLAGHKTARQFELWQAGTERATDADDENFTRILSMSPDSFVEALKAKNVI